GACGGAMSERAQSGRLEAVPRRRPGGGGRVHAGARDAARATALHRVHGWLGRARGTRRDPYSGHGVVRPRPPGGRMSKVLDTLDTAKFWAVVAAVLAFAVLAYAYGHNRKQATTNAATIARQQEQLSYLCETVAIIDAATTDRIRI